MASPQRWSRKQAATCYLAAEFGFFDLTETEKRLISRIGRTSKWPYTEFQKYWMNEMKRNETNEWIIYTWHQSKVGFLDHNEKTGAISFSGMHGWWSGQPVPRLVWGGGVGGVGWWWSVGKGVRYNFLSVFSCSVLGHWLVVQFVILPRNLVATYLSESTMPVDQTHATSTMLTSSFGREARWCIIMFWFQISSLGTFEFWLNLTLTQDLQEVSGKHQALTGPCLMSALIVWTRFCSAHHVSVMTFKWLSKPC